MPGERKSGWKFGINIWPFSVERSIERTFDDGMPTRHEGSVKARKQPSPPSQIEQQSLFPSEITCTRNSWQDVGTGYGHVIDFKICSHHSYQIIAWPFSRIKYTNYAKEGKVLFRSGLGSAPSYSEVFSPYASFELIHNHEQVKTAKSQNDNTFEFQVEDYPAKLSYWVSAGWDRANCERPFSHLRLEVGNWTVLDKSSPE